MKITYNWLKDFVEIKISPKSLAEKLTMAGLEVVSLEEKAGDFVLEIEITSNRPDWLSVYGIAREVAAVTGKKFLSSQVLKFSSKNMRTCEPENKLTIHIQDKKDCPLYTARIIRGVKVGPSPEWLRKRLELVGCRSVNNIVDITNYLLFELGEPMHAFDLDKLVLEFSSSRVLGLNIVVRRAIKGEELTVINGTKKLLDENILIIAAGINSRTHELTNSRTNKPIAIAGIMGGKETEVTLKTRNILLESAVFNPITVRRGRQALGLQSESSYRFERGIDLEIVEKASIRAKELIEEIAGGKSTGFKSNGLSKLKPKNIALEVKNVNGLLGVNIPALKMKNILSLLGFKVKTKPKNGFSVNVPSFRQDVNLGVDLIEEIARIYGYGKIPQSTPRILPSINIRERKDLVSDIKNTLVGLGLNEAITYSLMDSQTLNDFNAASLVPIGVMNPLSQEQEVLRTSLIPGLSRAIAHNLNQQQDYVALFEVANVFLREGNAPCEELKLGVALSGTKTILLNEGAVKDELGLLNLKGVAEALFSRLGIKDYEFVNQAQESQADIYINKEKVGLISMLSPILLDKIGVKNKNVFTLEVSLDKILAYAVLDKKYTPAPKYPGITRDISFILKTENSVKEMLNVLREKGRPLLRSLKIVNYYKGKQIPVGYRGLTLSCLYGSNERTLTEKEVQPIHNLICLALTGEFGANIR